MSFWHAVTGGDPAPTYTDLACLLAAFHGLGDCPCELPGFDPRRTSRSRLAAPGGVAAGDRDFLRTRCGELNEQLQNLTYACPSGRSTETMFSAFELSTHSVTSTVPFGPGDASALIRQMRMVPVKDSVVTPGSASVCAMPDLTRDEPA